MCLYSHPNGPISLQHHPNPRTTYRNYEWTEDGFKSFLSWLENQNIQNIDIWRTDIDTLNATNGTAQWIYNGIESFLSTGSSG